MKCRTAERELPVLDTVAAINPWQVVSHTSHTQQGCDDPVTS